jgi:hypothetical protein
MIRLVIPSIEEDDLSAVREQRQVVNCLCEDLAL